MHSPRNLTKRQLIRSEEGFALLAVLWAAVAVSAIGLAAMQLIQSSKSINAARLSSDRLEIAAEGALVAYIQEFESGSENRSPHQSSFETTIGEIEVSARMRSEAGKININRAEEDLLSAAFAANGLSEDDAVAIAAAIADWRDEDSRRRLHGAERADYAGPIKPADGPFQSVGELSRVRGISHNFIVCNRHLFTIYSDSNRVDKNVAGPGVREILDWADQHRWQGSRWQGMRNRGVLQPAMAGGEAYALTFEAKDTSHSSQAIYKAVIRISFDDARPFELLSWRRAYDTHKIFGC